MADAGSFGVFLGDSPGFLSVLPGFEWFGMINVLVVRGAAGDRAVQACTVGKSIVGNILQQNARRVATFPPSFTRALRLPVERCVPGKSAARRRRPVAWAAGFRRRGNTSAISPRRGLPRHGG